MDVPAFCRAYYSVSGIPLGAFNATEILYSSLSEALPEIPKCRRISLSGAHNPEYFLSGNQLEYGHIHVKDGNYDIVTGPFLNVPVSRDLVVRYMEEWGIPGSFHEDIARFLYSIPLMGHTHLTNNLIFLHYVLNGKEITPDELKKQNTPRSGDYRAKQMDQRMELMENSALHSTFLFEQRLYQHIMSGNEKELNEFFQSSPAPHGIGKVASTPLRQEKNIFIGTVTKIGMLAAIPAGVDVEKAYQMMDLYIQECEKINDVEGVNALYDIMIRHFCRSAAEARLPKQISPDVYAGINFIRSHLNMQITTEDVAAHVHRSGSHLTRCFKAELGVTVLEYITRAKLEEAQHLLRYSDKSLAEIASYLCFSSQSYFQYIFKKHIGTTPMAYRKWMAVQGE